MCVRERDRERDGAEEGREREQNRSIYRKTDRQKQQIKRIGNEASMTKEAKLLSELQ